MLIREINSTVSIDTPKSITLNIKAEAHRYEMEVLMNIATMKYQPGNCHVIPYLSKDIYMDLLSNEDLLKATHEKLFPEKYIGK